VPLYLYGCRTDPYQNEHKHIQVSKPDLSRQKENGPTH
jgi:hypothetical protein